MFDEMDRLRGLKELQQLLMHYRDLGVADRTLWQDRVCQKDGLEPRELVRLHGELIAFGWIEQNTGIVTGAAARRSRLLSHHSRGHTGAETARGGRTRCRLTETVERESHAVVAAHIVR